MNILLSTIECLKILRIKLHCYNKKGCSRKHKLESYTLIKESFTPISISRKSITKYHCRCGYKLDIDDMPEEYLTYLGIKSEKNSIDFVTQS